LSLTVGPVHTRHGPSGGSASASAAPPSPGCPRPSSRRASSGRPAVRAAAPAAVAVTARSGTACLGPVRPKHPRQKHPAHLARHAVSVGVSDRSFCTQFRSLRQRHPHPLLAPAFVDRRHPQPRVTGPERVHPFVDRHPRTLDHTRGSQAVAGPRLVSDERLAEQRFKLPRVLRTALAKPQLPGRVLQDLR
jgi:hypothetical protein